MASRKGAGTGRGGIRMPNVTIDNATGDVSSGSVSNDPKLQEAEIKSRTTIEKGRLDVLKEGLALMSSIVGLAKGIVDYKSTCVEWDARIRVASSDLEKAKVELAATMETASVKREHQKLARQQIEHFLSWFSMLQADFAEAGRYGEKGEKIRDEMHRVAELIVKLNQSLR